MLKLTIIHLAQTIEESNFETLESMAEEIASRLLKFFVIAKRPSSTDTMEAAGVRVKIKKPIAVPMAEAPAVEIYRSADPNDAFGKRMLSELGPKRPQVPFPLEGRLDDFLRSWKQD